MNLFETMIINIIFTLVPILIYFFYLIFERNTAKKENNLIFDLALLSSVYLLIKYSSNYKMNPTAILLNTPLVIAFLKKRDNMVYLISSIIVIYSAKSCSLPWFYFAIQYLFYVGIYLFIKNKKHYKKYFLLLFLLLKSFLFFITYIYEYGFRMETISVWVVLYLLFVLCLYFSLHLFSKCEEVSLYFINMQSQEQEKMLKSNLFRITHEIKNPIAVCKGYLDMFDVENVNHSKKYIPIMREEINRTLLLLQDFLSISKIRLEKDYMDVNMLIEDVMGNFSLIMKEKKIKSKLDLIDDDIYIMGDYNRLTQVLINLLKNSIEAIPEDKKGKIEIKTTINNHQFYIEIDDNGEGISEEVLKKIEEPFFTTKPNGTGLGVSLSREIIKAHHGKIVYDSKPFVGTKVKIWLPIEE